MEGVVTKVTSRINFFDGRLITAHDLRTEQDYFRTRMRRVNRHVHGFGIATGLSVKLDPSRNDILIEPGFGITPSGEEIEVCQQVVFKLPVVANTKATLIQLRYVERPVEPLPAVERESAAFAVIEETSDVFVAEVHGPDALTLARLVHARGQWKLDSKFRRRSLRRGR